MKNAIKKVLAFVLVIAMIAGVVPSVFADDNVGVFTDVKTSDWFAPFVKYVSEHKPVLMNGMTTTTFAPNANLTRAQAVVVLYRYADPVKPNVNDTKFTDLTQDWYMEGVVWAEKNGIVNGITETTFVPDGLMTREQLVTIIWRYAGEPAVNGDFLKDFPDAAKVSSYAREAFNWAISLGIIGGANGMLEPQGNATRAQFAKIISVYVHGDDHIYEDGKCIICGEEEFSASDIVILYTNDVHTYIDKAMSYDTVADMKAKIAEQVSGVLLVDAGDHIQGTAYGSMDKGENIIKMMSAAGYDAATLGNHEFDYGMERTLKLKDEAAYPYLSCNFYNEKNGVRGDNVLDSYKIFELGGKKVALVGVTTPESFTKSTPKYFQDDAGNYIYGIAGGEDGKALYADVQKAIDAAKAEGADYIIGLGHLGDDPASDPWNSEDVIKNVSGLNAFIDGHSHSNVPQKEVKGKDGKTVILTQTGEYFGAVGKMTINGDKITTELITEWEGSDAETKAIKDAWVSEVTEKLGEVIGHTALTFDNYDADGNRLVRKQETNTGDFAADALYYLFDTTEGLDVDVAIMNGGGVRNKAITGDISYLTCKDIHTFGNVACLQTVTGQQILDALEWGAKDAAADGSKENGGFLQVAGLTYRINTAIESTVRKDDKGVWTGGPTGGYRVSDVKVWDKEAQAYVDLDLKASYNLAGYNYTLRDLGDGFAMFAGAVNVKDYVMEDYMVIANYVKSFAEVGGKHEVVANSTGVPYRTDYSTVNGSGRITIVNEKPVEGFGLVNSASALKDGAEVVIYNPGHGMAISDVNDNNWYLVPETVAPVDNVIDEGEARSKNIVWTVVDNGDGTLSFVNGETDAIAAYVSGTYIELTNDKAYPDVDIKWKVSYTDGLAYIQSSSLSNSYGPAYIECYYNANKDKTNISGYTSSNPTTKPNDFGFQFYVLGAGGDVCVHAWAWDGVMGANGYHTEKCSKCQETREVACTFSGDTCSVCGAAKPVTGGEYALATSIKGGDKVVIYNPGHGMAIRNETDNNWYLVPQEITPVSDKIVDPDAILVWDVVDNGDGTFTFKNGTNAIAAYVSGTYIELTNDANYAGADIKWKVSYTDGLAYIQSSSLSNSYGPAYIECYYNANKDKTNISGYTSSNPTTKPNDFGFQFFVKDAVICDHVWAWDGVMGANGYHTEKCSKCPATRQVACTFSGDTCSVCGAAKPVTGGEYALATSIKGGDKVVIYNPGHGMAIRNETDNNWYLVPQEITPVSDKIVDPDAILVWDVVDNGDGTFTFKNGTNAIAAYVSGTYIELTNDANYAGADIKWKVSYTDGLAYIQSSSLSNSYGPAYIECYYNANKDKTNISGYTSSNPTTKPNDFGFQFFVKDAVICDHVWAWDGVMGANGYHTEKCSKCPATRQVACTFSGDTCSVCGAAKPVTGGEYGLASSIKGGDKVVIYNPGHGMAIRNETDNNWYLVPQEITPVSNKIVDPDAILVWDVVDNGDGTFTFKNGTNAIAAYVSGTYIELTNDANYAGADIKWKVSYTDGLAYIQSSSLSNSYGPAYIECYYNANKDKTNISGYTSSDPTTKPNDFGFQFYVQGGEPIVPPVPPTGNATIVFAPEDIWEDGTGYQLLLDKDADTYDEIYEDGGFFYYDEEDGEYYYYDGDVDAAAYAEFEYKLPANADGACDTENILAGKSATVTVPAGTYDIAVTNPTPGWEDEDEEFGSFEVPGYIYFPGNGAIDDYTFEAGKTYTIKVGVNPEYDEEDKESYYDIVTISVGGGSHEHAWAWDGKVGAAGKHTEICSECQETRQVACTLVEGVCSVCGYQKPVPSGDEIVIFYPGENKVMTTEEYTYSGKTTKIELVSADATLNGGVVSTEADNVALFKMIEDGDYVTFVTADSKYLYADGTDVKLVDAESDNTKFVIEEVSGGVYLKCAYAQYQGKPQYLEYYSGYFTVYGMGTNTSIYTFGLYPMEEIIPCDHLNTEIRNAAEPTCTKAGYTGDTYCLDCQRTIEKGTSIAALGHIDEDKDGHCDRCTAEIKAGYTVAASISVGDKIVIVANHDGTDYAAVAVIGGSDTKVNNALSARTASISDGALLVDDEAAIVWEVVAGSVDGTFMLKASDGKYLAYTSSGTTLKTAKDGTEFAITCGAGTAKIMATAEGMTNRGVSFRNNEGVAQFRLYTETNNSGQYSWNLTIYKLS